MLSPIDRFLNAITMYRLVLYGLGGMAVYAIFLAYVGLIYHGGFSYVFSLAVLVGVCWITNLVFAKLFNAPTNIESWIITALILFFLMFPAVGIDDALTTAFAGFVAIASKYFITWKKRHILNPVAAGAFAVGLTAFFRGSMPTVEAFFNSGNVVWWVGTPAMLPVVLIIGLLIVRKIRKFSMFFAFIIGAIVSAVLIDPAFLGFLFTSWPLIFFGTIMLTEPSTMPPHRRAQIIFGALVGLLFAARYHFGPIHSTPELALIVGNIFAFALSLKRKLMLTFVEKKLISKDTYEFSFALQSPLTFKPGEYLEWTIPQENTKYDNRGNRRYFTIASSPTEKDLKLGVKFYEPSSVYKQELLALTEGDVIAGGALGGDFILPEDRRKKLVFIAGGIGVTPFRSMIKYLSDRREERDIILIYSVKSEDEIAYRDIFTEAENTIGLRVIYLVKDFLNKDIVMKEVPDCADRIFYMSGPNVMVENYKHLLLDMKISRQNIKTDYFPGF